MLISPASGGLFNVLEVLPAAAFNPSLTYSLTHSLTDSSTLHITVPDSAHLVRVECREVE